MKRFIIVLILLASPVYFYAQKTSARKKTKSEEATKNDQDSKINTVELFIEIEAKEYFKKDVLEINLNLGENYKSMVYKKDDFLLFGHIAAEVLMMNSIPDLLNYLSQEGFEMISYTSFLMDDVILNKIILSQHFETKL